MEHMSKRPWLIKEGLRAKQSSEAKRSAEGTEILAPNYMTTRWGVQVVELEQRIEVLKECREAQAELGQAVAQRRGGGRSPERRPGSEARGVELKERVDTSVAVGSPGGAVGPIPTLTPTLVPPRQLQPGLQRFPL